MMEKNDLITHLGHNFANPELLKDALTHPSLAGYKQRNKPKSVPAYERLEFLGDRVLGLIIAAWLYEIYPNAHEGDLAKRYAGLVNRDALKIIALEIGLEKHLRLARGEEASGARRNLATLSDALEAIIGALYLDGGLEAAHQFIHRFWKDTIVATTPADPKTALQELVQGQGLPLPVYKVVGRTGPAHAPDFIVELTVKNHEPVKAIGDSKRAAEKAAAQALLDQLQESSKS